MSTYSERLQLLLTPALRERLEVESRRRGVSMAGVVREAIDAGLMRVAREGRMRTVAEIGERRAAFVPVDELERIVASKREEPLGRLGLGSA